MIAFTCKDCPNRKLYCHSTCEKYLNEKKENDRIRKLVQDNEELYRYTQTEKNIKFTKQVRKYGKSYI